MLKFDVLDYLETVFGRRPSDLIPVEKERVCGLPIFLVNLYQFFDCTMASQRVVFAQPDEDDSGATPAVFAKQVARLQDHFGVPVVLLLSRVESYQRNRLVQMGVPFIVPKRQLFFPQLMLDLREYFPRAACSSVKQLSYPAQRVILYHLLVERVGAFSLRELARRVGYSAMTLTKVLDELEGAGLCVAERVGRSKYVRFKLEGRMLWEEALSLLRTPVRSVRSVKSVDEKWVMMKAGLSALSEYTNINPDRIPAYAVQEGVFKKALMNGEVAISPDRKEAFAAVELWAYDPLFFDKPCVDELSLYLSLRTHPDERVQGELEPLMESRSW